MYKPHGPYQGLLSIAALAISIIAFTILLSTGADAQTIFTQQDSYLGGTGGAVIVNHVPTAGSSETGWLKVPNYRSVSFDIDLTDDDQSITAMTMVCYTDRIGTAHAADTGYVMQVLTATSASGVTTSEDNTLSKPNPVGAGVSKSWNWTVSNIPGPFLNCLFDSSGSDIADLYSIFARGITP